MAEVIRHQVDASDRRDFPRRTVLWSGSIVAGDYEFDCQVWNVSLTGAKVRVRLPLQVGADVRLKLPHAGDYEGQIMWSREGTIGLSFSPRPAAIRKGFGKAVSALGLDRVCQPAAMQAG